MSTAGDELAIPGMLWCSATQKPQVAELLDAGGPARPSGRGPRAGVEPSADGGEVEHGQRVSIRVCNPTAGTRCS